MKTLKLIAFALALVALVGSAGALEMGNIGIGQCLLQAALCALVMWLAVRKYK